jgi:hypothetical protein
MPTIIFLFGWRFFFYADEGNEPIHIHSEKAEKEAKYWLNADTRAITEAFAHHLKPRDHKQVKKIIAQYFDEIVAEWCAVDRRKKR